MHGNIVCFGFSAGALWRFLPGIVTVAPVGLFHRSAAGDGGPPPAGYGPFHLGSLAHFSGLNPMVKSRSFYLPDIAASLAVSGFSVIIRRVTSRAQRSVPAGPESGEVMIRCFITTTAVIKVATSVLTSPFREKSKSTLLNPLPYTKTVMYWVISHGCNIVLYQHYLKYYCKTWYIRHNKDIVDSRRDSISPASTIKGPIIIRQT